MLAGCRKAGEWLVKKDESLHADAMVILMGSVPDRILQAVDLYNNGVADKVLIVEGSMSGFRELKERGANFISGVEQVRNAAVDLGITAESIFMLKGNAKSTQEEALVVRKYLSENPSIDTLLLVSSSFHMRRAYMIFKSALRREEDPVYILSSPSTYTDFDAKKWWKSKEGIETVLLEYIKLMNFVLIELWIRQ